MKNMLFITALIFLILGCKTSYDSIDAEILNKGCKEVLIEGMDIVSIGGKLEVTIDSNSEYEELIYERFQKPLNDYWKTNYDSVLQNVKTQYPGLTNEEYEDLIRQIFYSVYPFKGTENWSPPKFDFLKYTLLGQSVYAAGCKSPDYYIEIINNEITKELIYKITITEYGTCEMVFNNNKWILISKIDESYKIRFVKEYIQN